MGVYDRFRPLPLSVGSGGAASLLLRRVRFGGGEADLELSLILVSPSPSPLAPRPLGTLLVSLSTVSTARAAFVACVDAGFELFFRSSSPHRAMITSSNGRSFLSTLALAIFSSVSMPDTIRPNTVCFWFKCGHGARVMKNLYRVEWISNHAAQQEREGKVPY